MVGVHVDARCRQILFHAVFANCVPIRADRVKVMPPAVRAGTRTVLVVEDDDRRTASSSRARGRAAGYGFEKSPAAMAPMRSRGAANAVFDALTLMICCCPT